MYWPATKGRIEIKFYIPNTTDPYIYTMAVDLTITGATSFWEVTADHWVSRFVNLEEGYSQITQNASSITARVEGLENNYSQIQITVDGINSTVSGLDDRLSEIEQSPGGLTLSAVYEGLRVAGIDITSSEEGEGSVKIYADQVTIQDGSSNNVLWVEDNTAKISNGRWYNSRI